VLAEIVSAIDRELIPAMVEDVPDDQWRRFLRVIAKAVRAEWAVSRSEQLSEGIRGMCHRISVRTTDIENWIRTVGAVEPPADAELRRKPGPAPGTLNRYAEPDRALYRELERIMRDEKVSVSAAATRLATEGKVNGIGSTASRGKRLAERYRRDR
jgi:hypothetical protein